MCESTSSLGKRTGHTTFVQSTRTSTFETKDSADRRQRLLARAYTKVEEERGKSHTPLDPVPNQACLTAVGALSRLSNRLRHVMIVPVDPAPTNIDLSNEIALDETRDALDPLRHLRGGSEVLEDDDDSLCIVPLQPRSTHRQLVRLSFPDRASSTATHVLLRVDASPGCGGIAWPAGEVLANYLTLHGKRYCTGRSILELGSGTGLVGLVAAKLGGKVWITDQAPLLDIMRENVKLNQLESSVVVSELNWGQALPPDMPRPDLVLAADCVYFEPAFPLLVETLSELATEQTEILFCYKKRRKADRRFFALLKKVFSWKMVEDDPSHDRYSREAISLLMLHRKLRKSGDAFADNSRR